MRNLWERRRMLAVGVIVSLVAATLSVYRVQLAPPSLESRTNEFATASTQIMVDTPGSAFADLASELDPLETRASVFSRFLASPAAIALIAREAKVPANGIEAEGPYDLNVPTFGQGPAAERRSTQIIGERALYRLRFENNPELPIIAVFSQAPSRKAAVALAAAAPSALRDYIDQLQNRQHTPEARRVEIRQLGSAVGAVVNRGASIQIATLVFFVVMVGWCMLLIPAQTIARGWREERVGMPSEPGPAKTENGDGVVINGGVVHRYPEHERTR